MCEFSKECPSCGVLMCYTRKDTLKDSIAKNRECKKCAKKDVIPSFIVNGKVSNDVLEKTSKTWFKKGDRPANADYRKGKTLIELYGEDKANEIIVKYQNRINTENSNIMRKESMLKRWIDGTFDGVDRKCSEETKNKHRLNMVKKLIQTHKNFHPPYNPKACDVFDKLIIENNIHIQHALNGGEYHIKELGYWVDGYDIKNNVVYEFDEKHHFNKDGQLLYKDLERQNKIINHLNCNFVRIKWSDII